MAEDIKVISETPAELVNPEVTPGEEIKLTEREALREAIEKKVEEGNAVVEEVAPAEEVKPAEETPKPAEEDTLKQTIQKRINKEVAKRKTLEEQLAEKEEEIKLLKAGKAPETTETKNVEPTIEQCEAYIIKCREEGDVKNEVAAMRYLVKLEKDAAIKEVRKEQEERNTRTSQATAKQQSDWINLNKDYESENPEINLNNQNGLLYKSAMRLYQDPDLREVYSDADRISGFRKAVHDAHRHILENGLHKKSETIDTTPRVKAANKPVLAEPSNDSAEETVSTVSKVLTDAEKVKEDILYRRANRYVKR